MLKLNQLSRGYSLVELMIALSLGAMLLAMTGSAFSTISRSNHQQLTDIELDSELSTLMTVMTQELQRAGYWQQSAAQAAAQTTGAQPTPGAWRLKPALWRTRPGSGEYDCLLFAYDADHDGSYRGAAQAAPGELIEGFGFRHDRRNKTIEVRKNERSCTAGWWEDLTVPGELVIQQLSFALDTQVKLDPVSGLMHAQYRIRITLVASLPNSPHQRRLEQWISLPNGVLL